MWGCFGDTINLLLRDNIHDKDNKGFMHTYMFSLMHNQSSLQNSWKPLSVTYLVISFFNLLNRVVCVCVLVRQMSTFMHLPLWVSEAYVHTLPCIFVSAFIRPSIRQKQHITQLSLHPKEGLLHPRMLLAGLRRIFLTVSLILCWQTEKHPHIAKHCSNAALKPDLKSDKPNDLWIIITVVLPQLCEYNIIFYW